MNDLSAAASPDAIVLPQPSSTDALIVGGGPAGLAAAIALRRRGIDCTVVEARSLGIGIDKACGEGLMPDTLDTLATLGVVLTPADGHAFRGIRFANSVHSVEASFPDGSGLGIRRPHLHRALAASAKFAGAHLLWNSRIQLPAAPDQLTLVNGQPIAYRWLIGADGQASTVRRWAGLDRTRKHSQRIGFRTHYRVDSATNTTPFVEIHWSPAGQLYLTPVAPDTLCVVFLAHNKQTSTPDRTNLLDAFPEVAARLRHAEPIGHQRGAVSATRVLYRVATEQVALLGDASGSADSITGEGLAMSFRHALALADSIASGGLAPYARAHAAIGKLPHAMGSLMLTLDRWPALEIRAMRALAANPELFRDLLAAHLGTTSLLNVLLRRGPRFALNLIHAQA